MQHAILTLALGLLITAPAAAAPLALVFRGDGVSRTVAVTETLTVDEEPWQGPPRHKLETREMLMERVARPFPPDHIAVERIYLTKTGARSIAVARSMIDARGIAPPSGGAEDSGGLPQLRLVLPPGPVEPGATWSYTRPPTRLFPQALEVRFKLASVTGTRAVIEGTCAGTCAVKPGALGLDFTWHSRVRFDVAGGRALEARVKSRLAITYEKREPDRPKRIRMQSETVTAEQEPKR